MSAMIWAVVIMISTCWVVRMLVVRSRRPNAACPRCGTPTLRLRPAAWQPLPPTLRLSWCYGCGWQGVLYCRRAVPGARGASAERSHVRSRG